MGTEGDPITVTVTNDGTDPASYAVSDVFLDADDADQFEIVSDSCTGTEVTDTSGCAVSLRHRPTAPGDHLAILVLDNDAGADAYGVVVAGFAYDKTVTADPSSLSFPTLRAGGSSGPEEIEVTNMGPLPVHLSSIEVTGPGAPSFTLYGNGCTIPSLPAGGFCTLSLRFTPTRDGSHEAQLRIDSDAPDSPTFVPLSGAGLPQADIRIEPAALDLGAIGPPFMQVRREFLIRNLAGNPVRGVLDASSLAGSGESRFEGTSCLAPLRPGAECRVTLAFAAKHDGPLGGRLALRGSSAGPVLASAAVTGRVHGIGLAMMGSTLRRALRAGTTAWQAAPRRRLLKRGFRARVASAVDGRLTLRVSTAPSGLKRPKVVATGRIDVTAGPERTVTARLTRLGRRLLSRSRVPRLGAWMGVRDPDGGTAAEGRRFRLR